MREYLLAANVTVGGETYEPPGGEARTLRGFGSRLKVAVTILPAYISKLQVSPSTISQPVQPAKTEPAVGSAVRSRLVPEGYEPEQTPGQVTGG
jgi:hypothetical protein